MDEHVATIEPTPEWTESFEWLKSKYNLRLVLCPPSCEVPGVPPWSHVAPELNDLLGPPFPSKFVPPELFWRHYETIVGIDVPFEKRKDWFRWCDTTMMILRVAR